MADVKIYRHEHPFRLEQGGELPRLDIAYNTFGTFNGSNAIWVCHALTANSDVADWWPGTVEQGRFLDPDKYFIVCANILGSHYGTTGPLNTDPATGEPYYGRFPAVTIRDMARCHFLLADHLNISRAEAVIGSSIGGFQAMEMEAERPGFAHKLVLIATSARSTPWAIGFNESQRMAIGSDPTFGEEDPSGGLEGLKAARSMALLSYRGSFAYNITQADPEDGKYEGFRVCSYQRYQGEKLARRFNAYSYDTISRAFDSHDIGRGRGGTVKALSRIGCPTLVVAISSDIIFPVRDQVYLYEHIPGAELKLISSDFGHDGFLVENDKLNSILKPFIEKPNR